MSSFKDVAKLFNTSFNPDEFFQGASASYVRSSLIYSIDSGEIPLIFLLGNPGTGKTYMLNLIEAQYKDSHEVLFSCEPFSTPESLLFFLLKNHQFERDLTINELKDKAISLYENQKNIIIIDEAQLLSTHVLEYIRILSDTGHFTFIISMHKEEGTEILGKNHFASRTHIVLSLEVLETNEILRYIQAQLLKNSMGEFLELFSIRQTKQIEKYSKGNFRLLKQMIKHIFLIMDYAQNNQHKKYTQPNRCVITMAAIDLGIINV